MLSGKGPSEGMQNCPRKPKLSCGWEGLLAALREGNSASSGGPVMGKGEAVCLPGHAKI